MIEFGLVEFLRSNTEVTDHLGTANNARIYPLFIPQRKSVEVQQYPCLVYAVTADSRGRSYCGTDLLVQNTVSIDSYAMTLKAARLLAEVVREVIIDYRGLMGSVMVRDVSLTNSLTLSDMEPGLIRVADTFSIWYVQE